MARRCTDRDLMKLSTTLKKEVEMMMFKWPNVSETIAEEAFKEKLDSLQSAVLYITLSILLRGGQEQLEKKAKRAFNF